MGFHQAMIKILVVCGEKKLVNVFIGKLVIFPNNELKYHCLVDIGFYKYRQLLQ